MFELNRLLQQSGLADKENVPWDGGVANPAAAPAVAVIRRLVHEVQELTCKAHKLEGEGCTLCCNESIVSGVA